MPKIPKQPIMSIENPPTQQELGLMIKLDLKDKVAIEAGGLIMVLALIIAMVGLTGGFGVLIGAALVTIFAFRWLSLYEESKNLNKPADGADCMELLELQEKWPEVQQYLQAVRDQKRLCTVRDLKYLCEWAKYEPRRRLFAQAYQKVNGLST